MPYQLARQTVEVRATPTTVEIFHQGKRIVTHVSTRKAYAAVAAVLAADLKLVVDRRGFGDRCKSG